MHISRKNVLLHVLLRQRKSFSKTSKFSAALDESSQAKCLSLCCGESPVEAKALRGIPLLEGVKKKGRKEKKKEL